MQPTWVGQRGAPMESPADGLEWMRVALRFILQRAGEGGFGPQVVQSVLDKMVARNGKSRRGARDVPPAALSATACEAKISDEGAAARDAEARGATECAEAARPTRGHAPERPGAHAKCAL